MTPGIRLHLITRRCPLWAGREDNSAFTDLLWAFYWPGGQVLTRFILDNAEHFKDRTVLDLGSGCGASAIACRMVGARSCVANDVDPDAIAAIKLNAAANNVSMTTDSSNLIGQLNPDWSVILLGDMFYDEYFRDSLVTWLTEHYNKFKTNIFIGDPGRLPLTNHPIRNQLTKVAEYELPEECQKENYGLTTGYVWRLQNNSGDAVT